MAIQIRKGRQVELAREAGHTAAKILRRVAALAVPGITTGELDAAAAEFMNEEGCVSAFKGYRGFPGMTCLSVNEEIVHGIGGVRKLMDGDILKIDVGIRTRNGWVGDNALSVPIGSIDPEIERLLAVTEASLHAAIAFAREGELLGNLCAAVEDTILPFGYSVVREYVGHGVGKQLHEDPQVPNFRPPRNKPVLREGMILAIEPMVNMGLAQTKTLDDAWTVVTADGKPSAHYEHTVLVTKGGPEILTPRDRMFPSPSMGPRTAGAQKS